MTVDEAPRSPRRVAVVGAGFAGLVAARELEAAGVAVEVFEARDRVGGRAWTEERLGRPLELGATWVHWLQPFVWAEICRYRQGIHPSPEVSEAYWITDGRVRHGTEAELEETLYAAQAKIFEGSREFFPYPHDPLQVLADPDAPQELQDRFRAADAVSVLEALRDGSASQEEIDLADSYWSAGYQGSTADSSALMAKHWVSLANHDAALLDELTLRFKLDNGMRGLYEAIAADVRGPIRLGMPVRGITATRWTDEAGRAGGVRVRLDRDEVEFDAVIVTVPLGALRTIDFSPALNQQQQLLQQKGFCSTGFKIWIKVAGRHSIIAGAPSAYPINLVKAEYFPDDDTTILVGFGHDHTEVDLDDPAVAQKMLDTWHPGLEVLEVTGHDWCADEWSGQTWATLRAGQFIQGWSLFNDEAGRIRFAGADWAPGWTGVCVDGALQSGITTARGLLADLPG